MKKEIFLIQGMHCVSCVLTIEHALKKVPGVKTASVSLMSEKATVEYEEPATPEVLKNAVAENGYKLIIQADDVSEDTHDHHKMLKEAEIKILKNKFIFGAILSIFVIVLSFPDYLPAEALAKAGLSISTSWRFLLLFFLTIPVEFLIGWQFWRGAWFVLKNLTANMDTL